MLFIPSILCLIIISIIVQTQSIVEILAATDNDIAVTKTIIQNTLNKLFSFLKLKHVNKNQDLKQYSMIHDFFYSITLQYQDVQANIKRLTKGDSDNSVTLLTTQLTELWNDNDKSDETAEVVYITMLIQKIFKNLDNFKEKFGIEDIVSNFDIHQTIINILTSNDYNYRNVSMLDKRNETYDIVTNDNSTKWYKKINIKLLGDNVNENKVNNTHDNPLDNIRIIKLFNYTEYFEHIKKDNDERRPGNRRVYLGKPVPIKKFPFMASIHIFMKFHCAGSIIKSDLIITSASCLQLAYNNRFYRENPAFLSVVVGNNYNTIAGEVIPVLEVYFYPNYNPKTLKHNLAIMRLLRHIKFSKKTKRVKRIEIDRNEWPLPSNVDGITVVGWGSRHVNNYLENRYTSLLSYAVLDFYPLRECQKVYSREYVTDRNFCAGFFSKGGGACFGDAGGPGISAGILVGVISFGSPMCGTVDSPTVFTKVGYYVDWIEDIMDMTIPYTYQLTTKRLPKAIAFPFKHMESSTFKTELTDVDHKYEGRPYQETDQFENNDQNTFFINFLKTIFGSDEAKDLKSSQDLKKQIEYLEVYQTRQSIETHESYETIETPKWKIRPKPTLKIKSWSKKTTSKLRKITTDYHFDEIESTQPIPFTEEDAHNEKMDTKLHEIQCITDNDDSNEDKKLEHTIENVIDMIFKLF